MLKTYEKIICFNHRIQAGSLPLRSNEDECVGRYNLRLGLRGLFSCILVTAALKRGRVEDEWRGVYFLASSLPLRSNEDEWRGLVFLHPRYRCAQTRTSGGDGSPKTEDGTTNISFISFSIDLLSRLTRLVVFQALFAVPGYTG